MNYINYLLIVYLLTMVPFSFSIAGELKIYSSEGTKTYHYRDSDSSNPPQEREIRGKDFEYDSYRMVSEKCIRGCDEEKATPEVPLSLPQKENVEASKEPAAEKKSPEATSPEKTVFVKSPPESERLSPQQKPLPEKVPPMEPSPEKTYEETVSGWKSYKELVKWMEKDFSVDRERYQRFQRRLPIPRTPKDTFELKSGIYIDAAIFLKEVLNRIDPSYKAQIVVMMVRPNIFNHYVCSFKKDGKIFVMDYGTPHAEITGVHGPYGSIEEYKEFYEKHHPMKRVVEAVNVLP